ncbi:MAG: hypothetical protein DRQ40_04360 [Gammaproteobacteria bacterium]|nr:MAG: hypothetical protein DRQ40_04360 [Gammaproteobacteria bacterium]
MDETAWLAELRPLLPGAVDVNIQQSIRSTINEFYSNTAVYTLEYPPINVVTGVSRYALPDIAEGKILYLLRAKFNGAPISVVSTGVEANGVGTPTRVWLEPDPMELVINSSPASDLLGGLEVEVSLVPLTVANSTIPDSAGVVYYQHILDGALGRMYKQPSKPWTNQSLSTYHLKRFRIGMAKATELNRKGLSSADSSWKFPMWA